MAGGENGTELYSTSGVQSCPVFKGEIFFVIDVLGILSVATSILVCCIAVFFIILLKWWTFFNQRLIMYLILATIISLLSSILSRVGLLGFCALGGFASQVGGWISLNANVCITAALLLRAFYNTNLEKLDLFTVIFIFLSPVLLNWIPFIGNTYGRAGPLCWIKSVNEINGTCTLNLFGESLQLVMWYVPLYVILSVLIILYIIISIRFCFHREKWAAFSKNVDHERKQALKYTASLLAYPLVYFFTNILPLITRVHALVHVTNSSPALWLLTTFTSPQHGTAIAIVFFVTVRKRLTFPKLKAAAGKWCQRTRTVSEYDFKDDVRERSLSMQNSSTHFHSFHDNK